MHNRPPRNDRCRLTLQVELSGIRWYWILAVAAIACGTCRANADPQALFDSNCALCHQKGAVGVRGQFPRLSGRIAAIAATAAGRDYLQQIVLVGSAGKVDVDGESFIGVMPPFASLSDEDLAAILNYLTQLGADAAHLPAPFAAADLAKTRSSPAAGPTGVNALRAAAVKADSRIQHKP